MGAAASIDSAAKRNIFNEVKASFEATDHLPEKERFGILASCYLENEAKFASKEEVDSFYCSVCDMKFKSQSKYDRHVKYSDLHAQNEALANSPKHLTASSTSSGTLESSHILVEPLFSGSKLFWRTSETFDVHLFLHLPMNVVECVAFDVEKQEELARMWVDGTKVFELLDEGKIKDQAEEERGKVIRANKLISRGSFSDDASSFKSQGSSKTTIPSLQHQEPEPVPVLEVLMENLRKKETADFIFSRLHIKELTTQQEEEEEEEERKEGNHSLDHIVCISKQTGDPADMDIVLPTKPEGLQPSTVRRRRRTSVEDFNAEKSMFQTAMSSARQMATTAAKLETISHLTLGILLDKLNKRRKEEEWLATTSLPRKRWFLTIKFVLRKVRVKKTREFLKTSGRVW